MLRRLLLFLPLFLCRSHWICTSLLGNQSPSKKSTFTMDDNQCVGYTHIT